MKFSISYPIHGTTKSINIDDDNKCRVFFEKRMGQQVEADSLGDEFKGYVFKITGGYDKDGFAMKQGIFTSSRLKLLLAPGTQGYRAKRTGQRKRKSVRGCIVGPEIKSLSVTIVKKGEQEIPGVTDNTVPRRLGPKRANNIRKLYGIERQEKDQSITTALIKKNVTRRTFKSKKNPAAERKKAPKIQRLITDIRLRRKRINKEDKIRRWKKTIEARATYNKLIDEHVAKRRAAQTQAKVERKDSAKAAETKPVETKKDVKPTTQAKPAATTTAAKTQGKK